MSRSSVPEIPKKKVWRPRKQLEEPSGETAVRWEEAQIMVLVVMPRKGSDHSTIPEYHLGVNQSDVL